MKNLYITLLALIVSFSSFGQAGTITGVAAICSGYSTTLSDTPAGGSWSSSTPGVASVGSSSGIVTGVASGTAQITYTAPGGSTATLDVTVNPSPAAITGILAICDGTTTTLTDAVGGGTWSSSAVIATIGSTTGIATGVVSGTTVITYTLATGCTITAVLSVNPLPTSPLTITPNPVCVGSTAALSDGSPFGTWSSSNPGVASISALGVLTGNSPGTTIISYTLATGCFTQSVVTVNASPAPITGTPVVCVGGTTLLTDVVAGGTWSCDAPGIATVLTATGLVTGISAGTSTMYYAIPTGCSSTVVVTVNPLPGVLSGASTLCLGGTDTVTGFSPPGYWSSSSTIDTALGTGFIFGASVGTTTLTYTSIGTTCSAVMIVTVSATVPSISGPSSLCDGLTITLSDATGGGSWSSSAPGIAVADSSSGIITGLIGGTAIITYTAAGSCINTLIVTVNPIPFTISGPSVVCSSSSILLTDATPGGTWISSIPAVATINPATGVLTGLAPGTTTISYQLATSCATSMVVTVDAAPAAPVISGTSSYCPCITFVPFTVVPSSGILWYASATGGTGSATPPVINTCIPGVTTNWASQTVGTCESPRASFTVTVDATPVVTASATTNCGGTFSISGSGAGTGGSYSWSPATGLSCTACAAPTAAISSSTSYTVTGTDALGCSGNASVALDADRISGYISLTAAPTDTLKIWLIQFNPSDSSLTAEDSTLSCMNSGTPYYEFDSKPAGSYMVKAKLLSSVPGTSGYVPTYGLSSNSWDLAATITHVASATDTQHINMIYGTVPPGPGFIGGLISSGAGRGTAGAAPAVGMLVYLKDAVTGNILTYTYTDATGAYSFSGIANGSYIIYPVDYHYHTTPWTPVALSTTTETINSIDYYEHTLLGTITPIYTTPVPVCCGPSMGPVITMIPNPVTSDANIYWGNQPIGTASLQITDMTGREVSRSVLEMTDHNGHTKLDVSSLNNGVYIINIWSKDINYTNKLVIQR